MSTSQKRRHRVTNSITINTPTAVIKPSTVERLLGAYVHQDMKWKEHIVDNDDSLVKSLNRRAGAIKKVSKSASFKTRKMLANGLYMSKLIYLMPVWIGSEDYLVNALQVNLNKVARLVTRLNIFTPTKVLMQQCGWMPIKHLMVYHSIVLLHKTLQNKSPSYLYQKVTSGTQQHNTRQAEESRAADEAAGVLQQPCVDNSDLDLCRSSWAWSSVKWYRQLPSNLKAEKKICKFKTALKSWVAENIDVN